MVAGFQVEILQVLRVLGLTQDHSSLLYMLKELQNPLIQKGGQIHSSPQWGASGTPHRRLFEMENIAFFGKYGLSWDYNIKIEYGVPFKQANIHQHVGAHEHDHQVLKLILSFIQTVFIQCLLCDTLWAVSSKMRKMDIREHMTDDREEGCTHSDTGIVDSHSAHGRRPTYKQKVRRSEGEPAGGHTGHPPLLSFLSSRGDGEQLLSSGEPLNLAISASF